MPKSTIPTLSLFSGAGGLDLGFIQAGFDIKACVEIEPSYCTTLKANLHGDGNYNPTTIIHCEDIRSFNVEPYRDMGIRCVIGGPPCQTFSAAGRRAGGVIGLEDDRGQLFRAYCRILDELEPDVFVFENVYGLPGANGGKPWEAIVTAFSKRGYNLCAEVVDAADYGVPQHRERLILVGHKVGKFVFPLPTHGPDSESNIPLVSVEEAIRDLQDPNEQYHNNLGGLYGHLLPLVPEGLNYAFFTAEMGHPEPVFAWRSKFHDLLYKVNRVEPCRTIKAQPGKFTGPFHWKNRHFTIPELKRLQTFPDSYDLVGSYGKVLEQIGNSVPPRLAFVIATSVREQLLEDIQKPRFPLRHEKFNSTFRQRQRLKSEKFAEIARVAIEQQYPQNQESEVRANTAKESYFLNPNTLFDRRHHKTIKRLSIEYPQFKVSIKEVNSHIALNMERIDSSHKLPESIIEISGLRKYLPNYDTLCLKAKIEEITDIFHAWNAIEETLIKRSRFFTLIDIYGHYANRGDTVDIKGKWQLPKKSKLLEVINYFSNTVNCGDFIKEPGLLAELKINNEKLISIIESMREIRFDIRTAKTHPIIGQGRIICTYPFPLLSPRALVESRARFTQQDNSGIELAEVI